MPPFLANDRYRNPFMSLQRCFPIRWIARWIALSAAALAGLLTLTPITAAQSFGPKDISQTRSFENAGSNPTPAQLNNGSKPPNTPSTRSQQQPDGTPLLSPEQQQTVDEIRALRERLGGSVTETLSELWNPRSLGRQGEPTLSPQQEFDQQLYNLATQAPVSPDQPADRSGLGWGHRDTDIRTINQANLPSPLQSNRLRNAARHCEQAAAELEWCGNYAQADSLRQQAQQLWQAARH